MLLDVQCRQHPHTGNFFLPKTGTADPLRRSKLFACRGCRIFGAHFSLLPCDTGLRREKIREEFEGVDKQP